MKASSGRSVPAVSSILENAVRDLKVARQAANRAGISADNLFAEVKRLMELEGVASRYTVHYDYDFPEDETEARRFATSDLRHYRSVMG